MSWLHIMVITCVYCIQSITDNVQSLIADITVMVHSAVQHQVFVYLILTQQNFPTIVLLIFILIALNMTIFWWHNATDHQLGMSLAYCCLLQNLKQDNGVPFDPGVLVLTPGIFRRHPLPQFDTQAFNRWRVRFCKHQGFFLAKN